MSQDRIKLNVVVRDLCAANTSNCQKELVVKRGFRVDKTQHQVEATLDKLLKQMMDAISTNANATGKIEFDSVTETDNYEYLWAYTTSKNGELIAGYFHLLPDSEITGSTLDDFISWLEMIVDNWMTKNGLIYISTKQNNPCSYTVKMSYELP